MESSSRRKLAAIASIVLLFAAAFVLVDALKTARSRVMAGDMSVATHDTRFRRSGPSHAAPVSREGQALARGLAVLIKSPEFAFEPNAGETNLQAKFLAHGRGYGLILTGDEIVLALASPQASLLNRRFGARPSSVAPHPFQGATGNQLRVGLISSPFTIQDSDVSPASSLQSQASSLLRLALVGANAHPKIVGLDKLKGLSNYFMGNDPKKWRTNVPNYARVLVKDVYPGIDQIFYGKDGQLEYDFVVHPGADPKGIRLTTETGNWKLDNAKWKLETGNSKLETTSNGDLMLRTEAGEVRLGKPVLYQATTDDGARTKDAFDRHSSIRNRQLLQGQYKLVASNELRFEFGPYDPSKTLVIDPTLNFIAIFGGTTGATEGWGVTVDSGQNTYVVGSTGATDFPTTTGGIQTTYGGSGDAIVRKIDSSGGIVYSTYLGGSGIDVGYAIAVDASGDAYIAGATSSIDFPVLNAFQSTLAGSGDAFVAKLNPTGSGLSYSSYLGGSLDAPDVNAQQGLAIAADGAGHAYVAGRTRSADFPTLNALQPAFGGGTCGDYNGVPQPCTDAFVTKVAPDGSTPVYSTFLGGSKNDDGNGIAVDSAGDAFVTGVTGSFDFPTLNAFQSACGSFPINGVPTCDTSFVTELNASGSALVFSTYFGGAGGPGGETGYGIALDSIGNIYVAGATGSAGFPLVNAVQSTLKGFVVGFVAQFDPGATKLIYSTYLGGSGGNDFARGIAVDGLGEAFVTGQTHSTDFPVANALQSSSAGAYNNAFVTGFQAGGTGLIYSTYLGGGADTSTMAFGIAADGQGDAWVAGVTDATNFVAAISRPEVMHRDVPPGAADPRAAPWGAQAGAGLPVGAGLAPPTRARQAVPLQSPSGVVQGLGGSIALDMARVSAAPASLSFGAEVAGTTSAPQIVTISNPGTAPLTFAAIDASEGFTVGSGGTCQLTPAGSATNSVPQGGNCTVDVAFAPTAGGHLTGTLTLTDNGIGSPHRVALSGTGQDFTLSTSQSSATLKAGVTGTFILGIAPQGGFNQPLNLTCDDPAPHSTCTISPASVTPGANGEVAIVSVATSAASEVVRGDHPRPDRGSPLQGPNGPPSFSPMDSRFRGNDEHSLRFPASPFGDHPRPDRGSPLQPFGDETSPLQTWPVAGPLQGRLRPALQLWLVALALLAIVAAASGRRRPRPLPSQRAGSSTDPGIPAFAGMTGRGTRGNDRRMGMTGKRVAAAPLALALVLMLAWAACGGGGKPGTPKGTYTITLKAANAQANLSHSTTVTVTVR